MNVKKQARWRYHVVICKLADRFFATARWSIYTRQTAISKHVGGEVPSNTVGDEPDESGLRRILDARGEIRLGKVLTPDFLLVIKHPSAFTAILESLNRRFPSYAVVRNPLAVLASWNSIPFALRRGHAPVAERLDKPLRQTLACMGDRTERQIHLLSWFFERYRRVLPEESILRYEDIVSSEGRALSVITPRASCFATALENRNRNTVYDRELMRVLGNRLLETEGPYWTFYTRESVEQLLQE
ncbi:MAG TPA: hypothetical protein VGX03_05390 [Candidatus Binatia bacterium]|jgi:hypothetical protein|nr:hypothetical protein [Candidatus Binatia bacterium]